ncbi:MAG: hypothetical protein Q8P78_01365 [bacterium]|nr:hypothetical protein [bacterium]
MKMAKSAQEYFRKMVDQPAINCVVCGQPVLLESAFNVDLRDVKALKGRSWDELKVSDLDVANAGVCRDHLKWITENGGTVFKCMDTLRRNAELAEANELQAEQEEKEREDRQRREADRRKKLCEVLSNFTFGDRVVEQLQSKGVHAAPSKHASSRNGNHAVAANA